MHVMLLCGLVALGSPGPWEPTPSPDVPPPASGSASEAPAATTTPPTEASTSASAPPDAAASATPSTPAPVVTASTPASTPPPEPAPAAAAPAPKPSKWAPRWEAARLADDPISPDGKTRWRPGVGVEVASKSGRFSLAFNAFVQMQAVVLHVPGQPGTDQKPGADEHTDFTLQFRRARMWLSGNIFTKNIKYRITLTFSPVELGFKDGVPHRSPILDWFFTLDRFRDFTLVVGQYKVPYNHQRMNKIASLQFVDRSLANNEFTFDRDIGLDLRSKDIAGLGKLRYYLGVYLGDGIAKYGPSNFGLMYLGRFEVLPFGQYDDLEESDLDRSIKPRMLIGAAYGFIDRDPHDNHGFGGAIPADGGFTSTHNATADLSFRIAGFSLDSAFFWRNGWRIPGNAVDLTGQPIPVVAARNGIGYFAQAGYLIPRTPLELGVRYGGSRGITGRFGTSLPDQTEVGGVVNVFFARHFLKLQLDYLRLYSSAVTGAMDQVRLQLQATF
ncbi:porin [Nannocystis sp. SCPEA4]|uniref:porin n=1 Tax=Nannocystis sp. SCPEA4 TaxID=2996787 RepID=UPI00226FF069|nr:porin [Nannocystis sp. SCPEA4]MCY1057959.1 porin [Nannocystis sp. SCPEA4]